MAVLLAVGAWLAYTGLAAKRALESAASALSGAQSALLNGDVAAASRAVDSASALTQSAAEKTSDPVWKAVGAVPFLGATPKAVTVSADAANQVISNALPQFVAAATTLDITTIKGPNGKVELSRFAPAGQQLTAAQGSLQAAKQTLSEVPTSGVIGLVSNGTDELGTKIDEALSVSSTAGALLGVMPGMLGATSPQTYFVGYQSPVEIRGTGGFLGTYGLLTVDQGELVSKTTSSNSTLKDFPAPVVDLGPDYKNLYGTNGAEWSGMNMSPNFPYAGVQWTTGWKVQSGQQVAGALAVDITAMKYLIQATGPVTAPDGTVLTADNVVSYLGNEIYLEYTYEGNAERKNDQATIANELIERVLTLQGGTSALVKALSTSVSGGHIQLWSASPQTQKVLATTKLAGQTSPAPGPYVQLVLNNGGGNKLDYYLRRTLDYTAGQCTADTRESTVRATLTNDTPAGVQLPSEMFGRSDPASPGKEPGSNRMLTYLHLAQGSQVKSARINGQPALLYFGQEMDHPVAYTVLELPPRQPVTLELDVIEPVSDAAPRTPEQPMVIPQETKVNWAGC